MENKQKKYEISGFILLQIYKHFFAVLGTDDESKAIVVLHKDLIKQLPSPIIGEMIWDLTEKPILTKREFQGGTYLDKTILKGAKTSWSQEWYSSGESDDLLESAFPNPPVCEIMEDLIDFMERTITTK